MANQPYTPKPITDIFTADTDIDRRQCKRVVPMKVLALGLGRTGTACECTRYNKHNYNGPSLTVPVQLFALPSRNSDSMTATT